MRASCCARGDTGCQALLVVPAAQCLPVAQPATGTHCSLPAWLPLPGHCWPPPHLPIVALHCLQNLLLVFPQLFGAQELLDGGGGWLGPAVSVRRRRAAAGSVVPVALQTLPCSPALRLCCTYRDRGTHPAGAAGVRCVPAPHEAQEAPHVAMAVLELAGVLEGCHAVVLSFASDEWLGSAERSAAARDITRHHETLERAPSWRQAVPQVTPHDTVGSQ